MAPNGVAAYSLRTGEFIVDRPQYPYPDSTWPLSVRPGPVSGRAPVAAGAVVGGPCAPDQRAGVLGGHPPMRRCPRWCRSPRRRPRRGRALGDGAQEPLQFYYDLHHRLRRRQLAGSAAGSPPATDLPHRSAPRAGAVAGPVAHTLSERFRKPTIRSVYHRACQWVTFAQVEKVGGALPVLRSTPGSPLVCDHSVTSQ